MSADEASGRAEATSSSKDEEAIENVVTKYVEAFRRSDIDSWGTLFIEDADFVGNEGEWARSRRENVALHAEIPDKVAEQMLNYSLRIAEISFVKPDVALVHAIWKWPGFVQGPSEEPEDREGIITMVMVKSRYEWLIRTSQNTRTR